MTMKRLWRKLEYSQWDNGCGCVNVQGTGIKLYFSKNRPCTYEVYKNNLMNYFKDYDEDYN